MLLLIVIIFYQDKVIVILIYRRELSLSRNFHIHMKVSIKVQCMYNETVFFHNRSCTFSRYFDSLNKKGKITGNK